MKFYNLTYANSPGAAWAGGYGPVEDLWFLNPIHLKRFKAYWEVNPSSPGLDIDTGGRFWPDVLGCGSSPPTFFVSDRIVKSLLSVNVKLERITELPIAEIRAKSLKAKPIPKYYVVETQPGIEVDLVASGFNVDANGKAILNPPPNPWPKYFYKASSWNGTDLFAYRFFGPFDGPYTEMLCTEKIKELAERDGWTNVRFQPLELV